MGEELVDGPVISLLIQIFLKSGGLDEINLKKDI
jgi:hypothetical protein